MLTRAQKRENGVGAVSLPLTRLSSNYILVFRFLHSHSLHFPWPFYWMWRQSNVSASTLLIEGWRLLPAVVLERTLIPQKTKATARPQCWSWPNYWLSLIGSLYELWWRQKVTLKARLLLLYALCVSPINLYVPPSPLPFYVQSKPPFQWARAVRPKVPTCDGRWIPPVPKVSLLSCDGRTGIHTKLLRWLHIPERQSQTWPKLCHGKGHGQGHVS